MCLLLTTALVGSNLFHSSLYLQVNQLTGYLQVLSESTSLSSIPSTISMSNDEQPFKCISLACLPVRNLVHTRRHLIMKKPSQPSKEPEPRNLEDHNSSLPDVPQDNLLINEKAEPVSIQQSDLSKAQNKDPKLRMIIRYLLAEAPQSFLLTSANKNKTGSRVFLNAATFLMVYYFIMTNLC